MTWSDLGDMRKGHWSKYSDLSSTIYRSTSFCNPTFESVKNVFFLSLHVVPYLLSPHSLHVYNVKRVGRGPFELLHSPTVVRSLVDLELRRKISVFPAMRGSRWYPHLGPWFNRLSHRPGRTPEAEPILVTGDGDLADAIKPSILQRKKSSEVILGQWPQITSDDLGTWRVIFRVGFAVTELESGIHFALNNQHDRWLMRLKLPKKVNCNLQAAITNNLIEVEGAQKTVPVNNGFVSAFTFGNMHFFN